MSVEFGIIRILFFLEKISSLRGEKKAARLNKYGGRVGNKCQVGLTVPPRNITRFANANFGPCGAACCLSAGLSYRGWPDSSLSSLSIFHFSTFLQPLYPRNREIRPHFPKQRPFRRSDVFPIPSFDYLLFANERKINWKTVLLSSKYNKWKLL